MFYQLMIKVHSFLKQCLHGLHFMKTMSFYQTFFSKLKSLKLLHRVFHLLGTIHKQRLLRGGGRGDPQKEMKGNIGRDLVFVEEASFLRPLKALKMMKQSPCLP